MLAEVNPEQFDEWMEMNSIVPFGDEKLCWVMALGFSTVCNLIKALAGGEPIEADFFIPWKRKSKTRPADYVSPNQAAAMFRSRFSHAQH